MPRRLGPAFPAASQLARNGSRLAGKPAEGPLDAFLGEPAFDTQVVFEGGNDIREPYLGMAFDGMLLAIRNCQRQLRRSEDGGQSWGGDHPGAQRLLGQQPERRREHRGDHVPADVGRRGPGVPQRRTGAAPDGAEDPTPAQRGDEAVRGNGGEKRGGKEPAAASGTYYLHASEAGVTPRHGEHSGRLLVSDFFPEGYTEEAALVELHDGRIYLLFEGGSDGRYSAMQVARLKRSWILAGEPTENGQVPEWVQTACDSCRDRRGPIFRSRRALAFAGIPP